MRGCVTSGIESLATRRTTPGGIESRDYVLPGTSPAGFRVREGPSEASTMSFRGPRHYPGENQPKDAE
jgi:hypothetical protein